MPQDNAVIIAYNGNTLCLLHIYASNEIAVTIQKHMILTSCRLTEYIVIIIRLQVLVRFRLLVYSSTFKRH